MSGQPPPGGQQPPPGQYPTPGQYPAPGQYPPPGQYPAPGGYYPPPGNYPPPGQSGGYYPPPPGYQPPPGGLPTGLPPGVPGVAPPNHPLAGYQPPPGYTPPQGGYPGAPPPGQYPGPAAGGYYPPPGQPGHYPSQGPGGYPGGAHGSYPSTLPSKGSESDSDPDDYGPRTREEKKPVTVKFVNRSGKKVLLFKIDKKGRHKKIRKLKDGKSETVETYETTAFIAFNMKDDAETMVIGDNAVYFASQAHSQVDIRREPADFNKLKSKTNATAPVQVKFINRSGRKVRLEWMNTNGHRESKKELKPGRCWRVDSMEGHCWVASNPRDEDEIMLLNYGWFYWPRRSGSQKERVVITEESWDFSSSSGSSSSSSSDEE